MLHYCLLDYREGKTNLDWVIDAGIQHLNISRAHFDSDKNTCLMGYREGLSMEQLKQVVYKANRFNAKVRLSCVLLKKAIESLSDIIEYLEFARSIGVGNVVFRQLMLTDSNTVKADAIVQYNDQHRVFLHSILQQISKDRRFAFQKQVVGYYYYVEVWKYKNIDVVFEEADLSQLEKCKKDNIVYELVFHPNGVLTSTWQPWDGVL
jgi:cyclic pyranopterin phosphate synthase